MSQFCTIIIRGHHHLKTNNCYLLAISNNYILNFIISALKWSFCCGFRARLQSINYRISENTVHSMLRRRDLTILAQTNKI